MRKRKVDCDCIFWLQLKKEKDAAALSILFFLNFCFEIYIQEQHFDWEGSPESQKLGHVDLSSEKGREVTQQPKEKSFSFLLKLRELSLFPAHNEEVERNNNAKLQWSKCLCVPPSGSSQIATWRSLWVIRALKEHRPRNIRQKISHMCDGASISTSLFFSLCLSVSPSLSPS